MNTGGAGKTALASAFIDGLDSSSSYFKRNRAGESLGVVLPNLDLNDMAAPAPTPDETANNS